MPEDFQPEFVKAIRFILSKKTLEAHHKEIKKGFKELFVKLASEAELIKKDNLAKGVLLELGNSTAVWQENSSYWSFTTDKLYCPIQEGDPAEYWGSFSPYMSDNFISNTSEYPWMPTPVSSDVPF